MVHCANEDLPEKKNSAERNKTFKCIFLLINEEKKFVCMGEIFFADTKVTQIKIHFLLCGKENSQNFYKLLFAS